MKWLGVAVVVGLISLTGCSAVLLGGAEDEVTLKEGCEAVVGGMGEVTQSLALVDGRVGAEAARVHLKAAEKSLEGVGEAVVPEELVELRDGVVGSMGEMLEQSRRVVDGRGGAGLDAAAARAEQALLELGRVCGF